METGEDFLVEMNSSLQNPYSFYKELRDKFPIVYSKNLDTFFVSRYDTCNMILKEKQFGHTPNDLDEPSPIFDKYMKEYGDKHPKMKRRSILSLNPPDHTRIRNLASRSFTPRAIEQLKPFIENLSENLLRPNGTHEIDLITQFAAPLPAYVIAKLMGVPEKDMPRFKILSDEFAKLLNPLSSDDDIYNGFVAKGELGKYFSDLMEIKERNPSDDLLSKMVTDMEGGYNITVEELLTLCTLLLVAGHETTTNLIGNGFYALMKNREQMNMLIDDRSLIKNAIEEMLRYDPPVQMVGRVSMTDNASIEGLDVAKNKFIAVMVGSANHDEEIFNEPEKFDITRKEIRHLSFSEGIHFCLGAPLARVEGAIAFDKLLDHLKGGKIIEQPRYRGNYNMRGLEHLRISF
ncbi:MAG: cytochrome P450 [Thermoplasmataceae archaeon]|jgi:pimeloyl-[acyl-carrier protein] synthase